MRSRQHIGERRLPVRGAGAGRVTAVRVSVRADDRVMTIVKLAEDQGVPVRRVGAEELSQAIGRELFAKLGAEEGAVVACGISCRSQIEQGTGRAVVHPCDRERYLERG